MRIKLICFLASFAYNICSGQDSNPSGDTSAIHWCENRKLLWSDFIKVKDTGQYIMARSHLSIPIKITMSSTQGLTFGVFAVFGKGSWTATNDYDCLQHEQLHFDIAELFARKIRFVITLNMKSSEAKILEVINEEIADFHETQSQFDTDTSHGVLLERQRIWRDSIDMELKRLNSFSSNHNCY